MYEGKGGSCADDTYSIGVNFSLDRSLWKDGRFGGDVGFNFSFFIRKVFDDDMTVDTRYVNGRVGNADWILRLYLGYEF